MSWASKARSSTPKPESVAVATPDTPEREWSDRQRAIFDWFANGAGHLIVRARAGTGKTTTILKGISYAPETAIVLAAFSKRIAVELNERLQVLDTPAQAKTLHAIGFSIVRRMLPGIRVIDARKAKVSRADALTRAVVERNTPDHVIRLVSRLHSFGRETAPLATGPQDLSLVAARFELMPEEWQEASGWTLDWLCERAWAAMQLAARDEGETGGGIDYADMIYLPLVNHWTSPEADLVIVDEGQDLVPAQLMLALGILAPGGRMCIVGDDRQAIFGFRGADSDSLDRLKAHLKAQELTLPVTYRCGNSIVNLARTLVPDYEAGPNNGEGEVKTAMAVDMMTQAEPGDFILSRTNAPLASVALAFIRANKRVKVAGKDIGDGLVSLIRKLARGTNSVPDLLGRVEAWERKQVSRALKAGWRHKVASITDQAETLKCVAMDMPSVRAVITRIETLFTDDGLGDESFIVCSTVHKAKGLESNRVFVLTGTLRTGGEEDNISYVAYTRAKQTLVLVS